MLTGCLLAYQEEADMIFKEADCLAFGHWVDRLYTEIGDAGMICGHKNENGDAVGLTANSLCLIKHAFLLDFVREYLSIPEGDAKIDPEAKFDIIAKKTGKIVQTTMGCDRARPLPLGDEAWYAQKFTVDELGTLRAKGLI